MTGAVQKIPEEDEDSEEGVTTIGFGAGGKAASKLGNKPVKMVSFGTESTQIGFGSASSKSVSFACVTKPAARIEVEKKKDECDNDDASEEDKSPENLFISEKARKEYLESQFLEAVEEYSKVIKRLEHANVLA